MLLLYSAVSNPQEQSFYSLFPDREAARWSRKPTLRLVGLIVRALLITNLWDPFKSARFEYIVDHTKTFDFITHASDTFTFCVNRFAVNAQVVASRGFCGHNVEYVIRLADFMRAHIPEETDPHLFGLVDAIEVCMTCIHSR